MDKISMAKTPRKLLTLFGEFIVEFNYVEFQCKSFLANLVEDPDIGHMLIMHQAFEFTTKRVDAIYRNLIEDNKLVQRWKALYPKIRSLQEIRNDIAHAYCDVNPYDKNEFVLTRFSERQTLNLSKRMELYHVSDLKKHIRELKKINIQLKHLLHSTFVSHTGAVFIKPPKPKRPA